MSLEGWHLEKGLISKILNWPPCANVTEVRGFLGTVGCGRKWIKGFATIAKPLTLLTKDSDYAFEFPAAAQEAMDELKRLVSTAPVLVAIDYKLAKSFLPPPRKTDDGAVIVAVDAAALYGAGWVVYQLLKGEKKPAIFGSCTFSDRENRYSQPKAELYGVFRALKHLRHRVWGLHFILEHDAKFLKEMINTPDLPNAPMTRWIQYLQLFDFEMHHVSADHHKAPDGLSRRRSTDADSDDDSDDQEQFGGAMERIRPAENLNAQEVRYLLSALQFKFALQSYMESAPYITYAPVEHRSSSDEPAQRAFITTLDEAEPHSGTYTPPPSQSQPRSRLSYEKPNSIFDKSLLRNVDPDAYCGYEFFDRHVSIEKTDYKCLLGDEVVALPIQYYVSTFEKFQSAGMTTRDLRPATWCRRPMYLPKQTTAHHILSQHKA